MAGSPIWAVGGLRGLVDVTLCQKINPHESCRMGKRIVVMKLICWVGHCECDGHTLKKLSQRRLTVDWLAPRESDFSRMYSKVSSEWLPSYIKATSPVLEIFKMVWYFPDWPRMSHLKLRLMENIWLKHTFWKHLIISIQICQFFCQHTCDTSIVININYLINI